MRKALVAALALGASFTPAFAQDRSPSARQALVDLSNVLGESHALRQACEGPDDQYWRSRMAELLKVEAPDQALRTRLSGSFNTGYAAGKARFPSCGIALKAQAALLGARGRALAGQLALP